MEKNIERLSLEKTEKGKAALSLLDLDLEIYEVDSTTMMDTMGASGSFNSCSSIVKTGL
ncbi:hypothetical protein AJ85_21625 [Alkalihalobacillus alcalophilus ATCC 27647 = CGMCC 1.3604]|uniref:Uncharacterized protein n=1 Tax=Alkalihalobacillus alcalophilus ATCC 27647 = CGMCC 1.3604 TaxID=1218173 RepID=A0A4S4K778_ALKAL|nr:hypothetical protein [Alkalihalobacillus alcalophilus]MED1563615.1 hypothetical protein [Alkalihalobacillus alcalophilus]THG91989.1 hypothetical protein AJ85_21625 [Alkalihalobacillus alcalophilus ATCC 27647 = CGMCC 1.3604]